MEGTRVGIFIFHNDLRIEDNIGLTEVSKLCDVVIPVFIFTPEQISATNKYRSMVAIEFMLVQLIALNAKLQSHNSKLYTFYGNTTSVVTKLIHAIRPTIICNNANYTPFALDRDASVKATCERYGCEYLLCEDYGLYPIGHISPGGKEKSVYKKFTPYYNSAKRTPPIHPTHMSLRLGTVLGIPKTVLNTSKTILQTCKTVSPTDVAKKLKIKLADLGRLTQFDPKHAMRSITNMKSYNKNRDKLTFTTSRLSAHIKFGTVSIRDVYWKARESLGKGGSDFIKQLYWREFYMNIVWAYPHVLQGRNFNTNYHANWKSGPVDQQLVAWCKGKTGVPIVDACMRELNTTGYMHNRGRLIVAGFLTKVLGWHWKFGELYFATRLRDYDPAQNNGNWQFVAGSGVDQQPYFRMFNPWLQSKAHDPDCEYIKTWCPEYKDFPNDVLHDEDKLRDYLASHEHVYDDHKHIHDDHKHVITPIVEYKKQRDATRKRYAKVK